VDNTGSESIRQKVLKLTDTESLGPVLRITFINAHYSLMSGHSWNILHVTSQGTDRLFFYGGGSIQILENTT